ncbi:DegV family protein [Clostridium sp. 'deep sea']|uniref:DegV family protein n=1 Tax=Clostridium sp. 'deep sea' TaxID=2779445 RepID=UPI001896708D|nr:DegV family protein [Clostridium sp. 'deep sea']QOR33726.1 DegV family protein [Clostridium sp. 'deep sea']
MNNTNIAVVTDSCADIPASVAAKMNIEVIPLQVIFGHDTYRDGIDIKSKGFFDMLSKAEKLPTTAHPSPKDFSKVYKRLLEKFDHVLSIHLSEKLSGTIKAAKIAAQEFKGRVFTWDTHAISVGVGLQVCAAAQAVKEGKPLSEIRDLLSKIRETSTALFSVDTLEYLQKGGRIGKAASLLGTVLNIKPIIIVKEGYYHAFGKGRSRKKAVRKMLNHFIKVGRKNGVKRVTVGHGLAPEEAKMLADGLYEEFGVKPTFISDIGPVIATHVGPGAVGAVISSF